MAKRAKKPAAVPEILPLEKLIMNGLEGWLWDAACSISGTVDATTFKDSILPLIFVKRLSRVVDDEIQEQDL